MTATDAPAGRGIRSALCIRLAELGAREDDQQRHVCAVWTRGRARTRRALTEEDARTLVRRLRTMTPDELAEILRRPLPPAPEPEPAAPQLPAGTIACGPGALTEHDAEQVRRFAEFLETAGPSPVVEHPAEEVAEEQSAPAEDVEPPAEEQPAPAPVLEPPCRTPEEIEAAAVAAVERCRARQAAGIVPEAPALGSIPPRVVEPYTAPGRYCLVRCYCGSCEQYAAQREAAERVYRQELTAARNRDLRG